MTKHQKPHYQINTTKCLTLVFELGDKTWKLAFGNGIEQRYANMVAGDQKAFKAQLDLARKKLGFSAQVPVFSCYEAGRDGFWLHRYLTGQGIINFIVDPASIEVPRKKRRRKTDRLDAKKLLRLLIRYLGGETDVWSIVRVPTLEQEDARSLHRQLADLKKERGMHLNRISSLLVTQGIRIKTNIGCMKKYFLSFLEQLHTADRKPFPEGLKRQLKMEQQRWFLVQQQIEALYALQRKAIKEASSENILKVRKLTILRGIGDKSAWILVFEFFGWRKFNNTKEVGASAGLTSTPYASGDMSHEQGISKAGNRQIRWLMNQVAWRWLYYQPNSQLSLWFQERFAQGSSRVRRIGITAVSRKLLVALWKYLQYGTIPQGAVIYTDEQDKSLAA